MKQLSTLLASIRAQRTLDPDHPALSRIETYACPRCRDAGWLVAAAAIANGRFTQQLVPCSCNHKAGQARTPALNSQSAEDSALRLSDLEPGAHNRHAFTALSDLAAARAGFLTLTGAPGPTKSRMLHALVNEMRRRGVDAAYSHVADLLDHLRTGFGENNYDRRWRSLVELPALAIDDLEQFAATEWANERLAALIDQRWRTLDRCLTAVAVSTLPGQLLTQAALPERIIRRLTDARSIVVTVYEARVPQA